MTRLSRVHSPPLTPPPQLNTQLAKPREPITVTLPDGSERAATSWQSSPMDIAKEVSKSLSERIVIAKARRYETAGVCIVNTERRWMGNSGI